MTPAGSSLKGGAPPDEREAPLVPNPSAPTLRTVSSALVRALEALGVQMAFGVIGGAISSFCRALSLSSIDYLHFRHESGAAFAALEASLATRRPTVVFTTAGPGLTNALTGMSAARWEGAHVLLVSACTSLHHRGRAATQETGPHTLPSTGLFQSGAPFHHATILDHAAGLEPLVAELSRGFARKDGFVAHVSLPIAVQSEPLTRPPEIPYRPSHPEVCPREVAEHYARLLRGKKLLLWTGFGARGAAEEILALAEATGAHVISSPRGKGTFPEDHPMFLGVTGLGGDADVDERVAADPPEYTLVLGTRMGESTSFWARELAPRTAFVHVDVNPTAFCAAYPGAVTHAVESDARAFLRALLSAWPDLSPRAYPRRPPASSTIRVPKQEGRVRPQVLMDAVQRVVIDRTSAIVLAESGNSFCWATNLLRFKSPGRYRVSTGFGSMGHATTGVVGAALATKDKAVAITGDGAMLMLSEISSAVQYGARAVWVVLNDACYLMCEQGMQVLGWHPFGTRIPEVDFVAFARSMGADGERVSREADLGSALERAMAADLPFVLDVQIDAAEIAPSGKRHRNLLQQGSGR